MEVREPASQSTSRLTQNVIDPDVLDSLVCTNLLWTFHVRHVSQYKLSHLLLVTPIFIWKVGSMVSLRLLFELEFRTNLPVSLDLCYFWLHDIVLFWPPTWVLLASRQKIWHKPLWVPMFFSPFRLGWASIKAVPVAMKALCPADQCSRGILQTGCSCLP